MSWMVDALCTQVDPDMFFPPKGGPTKAAKALCARCPVIAECAAYAREIKPEFGIWAGVGVHARREAS